jgi:hypothetical protein
LFQGTKDPEDVKPLFKKWVDGILTPNSKGVMAGIIILTYGLENYNSCATLCQDLGIDCIVIDVLSVALFINDCDGMHLRKISFPKTKLTYLCSAVGEKAPKGHWYECMQIANFYKGVTEKGLI